MRKEGLFVSFKMPRPILKLRNQFLGRLAAHYHRLRYIDVITYSYRYYQWNWNVLTLHRLRYSALHMRSVRKDDIIRQRHLPDGFLKTQGTSIFAIVSPECPISPIRRDNVTIIFVYAVYSTRRPQTLI